MFNDRTRIEDVDGNKLQTIETDRSIPFMLVVLTDSEVQAAATQSNVSLLTLVLTFGTSTIISILLGGTVEATWLLFGAIQLMSFVPLLNMNLPANFREFSKNLAALHGEPEAIPNLFEIYISKEGKLPFTEYFELMSEYEWLIFRFRYQCIPAQLCQKVANLEYHAQFDVLQLYYARFVLRMGKSVSQKFTF